MSIICLASILSTTTRDGLLVGDGIILDGNLCCHTTYSMGIASMAGFNSQQGIGTHEMCGHCHLHTVREDKLWNIAKLFDGAEDVIPASTVEDCRVFPQFVQ